ncbi:SGPL1 lyase, partial [Pomatorhinus ruficollis]|nr:SGPL1 lyase [Pomatorhinus ruficollis]
ALIPYKEILQMYWEKVPPPVNARCDGLEPCPPPGLTFSSTLASVWLHGFLCQPESLTSRTKKQFFKLLRKMPFIPPPIDEALNDVTSSPPPLKDEKDYIKAPPPQGMSQLEVLQKPPPYSSKGPPPWQDGKVSGTVYPPPEKLTHLLVKVYEPPPWSNPLHPDIFPPPPKMEAEVVRIASPPLHGGPNSCGAMTSGGTESPPPACKAYRDLAYERGIKQPEMLVPVSAHAPPPKAAHYFGMKLTPPPLTKAMEVDVQPPPQSLSAMRRPPPRNTAMLVCSAPPPPHGIMDPIEELAVKYKIPFHVDACLGGFLIAFMDKAGFPLKRPFDFLVEGVTSISADTHKYGYAPKGSSVVLYSDKDYRKPPPFIAPDWQGGIYPPPSMAGSRPGGITPPRWATLLHIGESPPPEATKRIIKTARPPPSEYVKIDSIFIFGTPPLSVLSIGSDTFPPPRLSNFLAAKGCPPPVLQFPPSIHPPPPQLHTKPGVAEPPPQDVRDSIQDIMKDLNAKTTGMGAIYPPPQSIPDRSLVAAPPQAYLDGLYSTDPPPSDKHMNGSPGHP